MDFLFNHNGRFSRWQYWTALLFNFMAAAAYAKFLITRYDPTDPPLIQTQIFFAIVTFTIAITLLWSVVCATIKRYHDMGVSGVWWLVIFIPVLGWAWQIIECGLAPGDNFENGYGLSRRPKRAKHDEEPAGPDLQFMNSRLPRQLSSIPFGTAPKRSGPMFGARAKPDLQAK